MKKYKILRAAVTQSKRIKAESVVNFQTITLILKNLNDLVKLYKNKQIAEENKTKSTAV
jgi:3-methyladenine DNA glycosylase AlkC